MDSRNPLRQYILDNSNFNVQLEGDSKLRENTCLSDSEKNSPSSAKHISLCRKSKMNVENENNQDDQENRPPRDNEVTDFKFKRPVHREKMPDEDNEANVNSVIDNLNFLKLGTTPRPAKKFNLFKWTTPLKTQNTRVKKSDPDLSASETDEEFLEAVETFQEYQTKNDSKIFSVPVKKEKIDLTNNEEYEEFVDAESVEIPSTKIKISETSLTENGFSSSVGEKVSVIDGFAPKYREKRFFISETNDIEEFEEDFSLRVDSFIANQEITCIVENVEGKEAFSSQVIETLGVESEPRNIANFADKIRLKKVEKQLPIYENMNFPEILNNELSIKNCETVLPDFYATFKANKCFDNVTQNLNESSGLDLDNLEYSQLISIEGNADNIISALKEDANVGNFSLLENMPESRNQTFSVQSERMSEIFSIVENPETDNCDDLSDAESYDSCESVPMQVTNAEGDQVEKTNLELSEFKTKHLSDKPENLKMTSFEISDKSQETAKLNVQEFQANLNEALNRLIKKIDYESTVVSLSLEKKLNDLENNDCSSILNGTDTEKIQQHTLNDTEFFNTNQSIDFEKLGRTISTVKTENCEFDSVNNSNNGQECDSTSIIERTFAERFQERDFNTSDILDENQVKFCESEADSANSSPNTLIINRKPDLDSAFVTERSMIKNTIQAPIVERNRMRDHEVTHKDQHNDFVNLKTTEYDQCSFPIIDIISKNRTQSGEIGVDDQENSDPSLDTDETYAEKIQERHINFIRDLDKNQVQTNESNDISVTDENLTEQIEGHILDLTRKLEERQVESCDQAPKEKMFAKGDQARFCTNISGESAVECDSKIGCDENYETPAIVSSEEANKVCDYNSTFALDRNQFKPDENNLRGREHQNAILAVEGVFMEEVLIDHNSTDILDCTQIKRNESKTESTENCDATSSEEIQGLSVDSTRIMDRSQSKSGKNDTELLECHESLPVENGTCPKGNKNEYEEKKAEIFANCDSFSVRDETSFLKNQAFEFDSSHTLDKSQNQPSEKISKVFDSSKVNLELDLDSTCVIERIQDESCKSKAKAVELCDPLSLGDEISSKENQETDLDSTHVLDLNQSKSHGSSVPISVDEEISKSHEFEFDSTHTLNKNQKKSSGDSILLETEISLKIDDKLDFDSARILSKSQSVVASLESCASFSVEIKTSPKENHDESGEIKAEVPGSCDSSSAGDEISSPKHHELEFYSTHELDQNKKKSEVFENHDSISTEDEVFLKGNQKLDIDSANVIDKSRNESSEDSDPLSLEDKTSSKINQDIDLDSTRVLNESRNKFDDNTLYVFENCDPPSIRDDNFSKENQKFDLDSTRISSGTQTKSNESKVKIAENCDNFFTDNETIAAENQLLDHSLTCVLDQNRSTSNNSTSKLDETVEKKNPPSNHDTIEISMVDGTFAGKSPQYDSVSAEVLNEIQVKSTESEIQDFEYFNTHKIIETIPEKIRKCDFDPSYTDNSSIKSNKDEIVDTISTQNDSMDKEIQNCDQFVNVLSISPKKFDETVNIEISGVKNEFVEKTHSDQIHEDLNLLSIVLPKKNEEDVHDESYNVKMKCTTTSVIEKSQCFPVVEIESEKSSSSDLLKKSESEHYLNTTDNNEFTVGINSPDCCPEIIYSKVESITIKSSNEEFGTEISENREFLEESGVSLKSNLDISSLECAQADHVSEKHDIPIEEFHSEELNNSKSKNDGITISTFDTNKLEIKKPIECEVDMEYFAVSEEVEFQSEFVSKLSPIPEGSFVCDEKIETSCSRNESISNKIEEQVTNLKDTDGKPISSEYEFDDTMFCKPLPVLQKTEVSSSPNLLNFESCFNADYCAGNTLTSSRSRNTSLIMRSPALGKLKSPNVSRDGQLLLDMSISCFEQYTANAVANNSNVNEFLNLNRTVDADDSASFPPKYDELLIEPEFPRTRNVKTQTHNNEFERLKSQFNDLVKSYNGLYEVCAALRENEKNLMMVNTEQGDSIRKLENKYELLKDYANQLLAMRNNELDQLQEVNKILRARVADYEKIQSNVHKES